MSFYKQGVSRRKTIPSEKGTREKMTYRIEIDKETGHKEIVFNGMTDTYEKIQAGRDAADINNIIARAQRGDMSGIKDMTKAIYGDMQIPDNMIDIANLKLKIDQTWERLPLEIRKEYNHDPDLYFADYGSDHWKEIHGFTKKIEDIVIEKEPTNE